MTGSQGQLYYSNISSDEYFHNTVSLFLREVYELMKNCYGPYGSHIMINTGITPEATKDGKTILSKVKTNGSISTAVHGAIMSVADKQVSEVGDGSTTTILLLCKLYERFRNIIKDHNISPSVFNKYLKNTVNQLKECLKDYAKDITALDNMYDILYDAIYTSVDADSELAETITEMFKELNCIDPLVLIEMSKTESHSYELVKGLEVDGSIIRPDVFFGGFSRQEYENPNIVVVNGRLDLSLEYFCNVADYAIRNNKDIIFLCTGINETVLENIVNINNLRPGQFNRIAVFQIRQTAQNDEFLDTCAGLGAHPIDSESFKKALNFPAVTKQIETNAGTCSKALLTEFCARFNDPKSDEKLIDQRLSIINEKIEDLEKDASSHNDRLTDLYARKAFLSKHYAKFYVGGYSPQRKAINYELANDGIPQAISCMKHGVVEGCNVAIPNIIKNHTFNNDLEKEIADAICKSYIDLFVQIVVNKTDDLYGSQKLVSDVIDNTGKSLNIRNGDRTPVINSADTDRAILENSTDMASLLATAKGFISQNTEFDVISKGFQFDITPKGFKDRES